ncbi:AbfB domain-containing protein [Streptomyces collinus]|uniref:Alpha-L-arabinofuranosidase n=1 Tax=Streptomyces collinus (strain DSM 40733 / Tue 365) TaxID=1214242 RepID=S5VK34_STRC3|nr:AbfB domain-containing protein [Streptomyces collinus]AGS68815.1 alpha-L-arabinofuranosidase [Streptomyces collinus Tu 365]UJA07454.1 alpha-L-arabinofuranosidase [Streptomyces collinus]UJA17680.1 alpha-L-arabinofuranosidase [Streptomyces collinus]
MPDDTPRPPHRQPWDHGWHPDASRTPGTRRLWLAGALALATIAAGATAIAVNDGAASGKTASPATPGAPSDSGPGLLSFASPSAAATAPSGAAPHRSGATPSAAGAPSAARRASGHPDRPASGHAKSPEKKSGSPEPSSGRRSVRSLNHPDRYWHVSDGLVRLDPAGSAAERRDATFTVVKGLAKAGCYSFATADGGYLRHRNFLLRAEHDDGSRLFEQDATFCPRTSAFAGAVMLESVNYPGRYLRHQDFQLKLDPYQDTDLYRADSAFLLVSGLA